LQTGFSISKVFSVASVRTPESRVGGKNMLGLKLKWIVILAFICAATVQAEPVERLVDAPENRPYRLWPSRPPENCPFKPSDAI
jgi:hypothetical protein